MLVPILAAKHYFPAPRSTVILRPRLVERLNEGFSLGWKLTLVSAFAGSGKTTLISELDLLQPQMHMVITIREDPHLSLARHRARGQLTEICDADLR